MYNENRKQQRRAALKPTRTHTKPSPLLHTRAKGRMPSESSTSQIFFSTYTHLHHQDLPMLTAAFFLPDALSSVIVRECLQALRVVVVLLGALEARGASRGASEALATALSPLLDRSSSGGSSSRLGDSCESSRLGAVGRRSWVSGSWVGRSRSRRRAASSTASAAPQLRSRDGVAREAAVDVEKDTRCVGGHVARNGDTGGESSSAGSADLDVDLGSCQVSLLCVSLGGGKKNICQTAIVKARLIFFFLGVVSTLTHSW